MSKKPNSNPVYGWSFTRIYPLYVAKAEKKGKTKAEVNQIIEWLLGYDDEMLKVELAKDTTLEDFVMKAPKPNPNRKLITGIICSVRVEDVKESLVREVRYLDKLVDELAKGKSVDKILRQ